MPDIFDIAENPTSALPAVPVEPVKRNDIFAVAENPQGFAAQQFVQESAEKEKPWKDVAARLKDLGVDGKGVEQDYQLRQAKQKAARPVEKGLVERAVDVIGKPFGYQTDAGTETTLQKFGRSYMPFGDLLGNGGESAYSEAVKNIKAGKATQADYDAAAKFEQRQKNDAVVHESSLGRLAENVGGLSKIVGEAGVAGKVLGTAGRLTGIGQTAAATQTGRAAQFLGQQALSTAITPSLYLPMARQKNLAEGRDANDWRGFPTAVAYGYANMLVLGRLQGGVSQGNVVTQALKKGALGAAELTGVDVAAGIADEFLPKALQVGTKYGTLGQLARGAGFDLGDKANPKELQPGLEHAVFQILSFSGLAAMHGRNPVPVLEAGAKYLDRAAAAGDSKEVAGQKLDRLITPVEQILRDPNITREDAIQRSGEAYKNPVIKVLIDALPEASKKATINPEGSSAPLPAHEKGETFHPPEAVPEPVVPVVPAINPQAETPRSPLEVLGEQGIRDWAKAGGIKNTDKIETVLKRIASSPSASDQFNRFVNSRQNPTAPQIAQEAPKTAPEAPGAQTVAEPSVAAPEVKPVEPVAKGETFHPPAPTPKAGESRVDRLRRSQAGRVDASPEKAEPQEDRDQWRERTRTQLEDSGVSGGDRKKWYGEFEENVAKYGWPKAREMFDVRLNSRLRQQQLNDAADEREYHATPYEKIGGKKSVLDPLIDRLAEETGRGRGVYEDKARAAKVAGGDEALDVLAETWANRLEPFKPRSEAEQTAVDQQIHDEEENYAKLKPLPRSATNLVGADPRRELAGTGRAADRFLESLREAKVARRVRLADEVTNAPGEGGAGSRAPEPAGDGERAEPARGGEKGTQPRSETPGGEPGKSRLTPEQQAAYDRSQALLAEIESHRTRTSVADAEAKRAGDETAAMREDLKKQLVEAEKELGADHPAIIEAKRIAGFAAPRQGARAPEADLTDGAEGVVFHKKGEPNPPKGETFHPPEPGKPIGPFELSATIDHLLGITNYTEGKLPYGNGEAAAVAILKSGEARPQAVVTQKMYAGDPAIRLEEAGHVLAARHKLELDPTKLPKGVADGFAQFWGKEGEPVSRLTTLEGFSAWLVERTAGRLSPSTPEQKAASEYAERFVKENGLDKALSQLEPFYRSWEALGPIEKAGKLLSGNGLTVNPELTPQQKAKAATDSLRERFQDDIENNLGPALRLEAHLEATAAKSLEKRLGRPLTPEELQSTKIPHGEKYSTVLSQLMGKEKALAGQAYRDGVFTLKDGKLTKIGQSFKEILGDYKPEWITPIFEGGPSKFDIWAVARSIEGEFARREQELQLAKRDPKQEVRPEPVPEEQRKLYAEAKADLEKDKDFVAWAEPAAVRLTRGFKATVEAIESKDVHAVPEGTADRLDAKRPEYVPHDRVISDTGWNFAGGGRGESARKIIRARSGSGEQIVSPLVSYQKRLLQTYRIFSEQLKSNALLKLSQLEGAGDYLLAGEAKLTESGSEKFKQIASKLAELGLEGTDVVQVLKDMGVQRGESYFTSEPWPKDPTKATKEIIGPDGKVTSLRVKDRGLYDLATDQQVDAHQTARIINGIANLSIGGVKPVQAIANLVRLGATSASLAFNVKNIPRDAFTFFTNTIDRASIGQLPDALKRAFAFEFGVLKSNLRGETFQSSDRLFKLFHDLRGTELRQFGFDQNKPQTLIPGEGPTGIKGKLHSVAGFAKDALSLLGAGELGPRFLEFKNRLKQVTGLDEAGIVRELEKADAAAQKGEDYQVPFDMAKLLDAMDAAHEVTTPFGRQGTLTRELNKIQPFFGPAVAGVSKAARNVRDNPKGAMIGLAAIASLRVMHWLAYKDEDWYGELSANDRYRNFVVPTPFGLRRLPAPRGFEVPVGGFLLPMLDKAYGKNPDVKGLLSATWDDLAPPKPITPLGTVGLELATNSNWMGTPIVPKRDEHLPAGDKALKYQVPYAAEQLTGGRGALSLKGAGLVPFAEVKNARRSVDDFYETFQALEQQRASARGRGETFHSEGEFQRYEQAKKRIEDLNRQVRGEHLAGGRVVKGEAPSEQRVAELKALQIQIARQAQGRGK